MDFSLLMAKVIAGYFIISGLFVLLRGKTFMMVIKDFFKHPALVYLAAIILVFAGLTITIRHNVWDGTWRTWVTVFGVLILLKGLAYVFISDVMAKFPFGKMGAWLKLIGLVMIAIGGYLWSIS